MNDSKIDFLVMVGTYFKLPRLIISMMNNNVKVQELLLRHMVVTKAMKFLVLSFCWWSSILAEMV